MILARFLRTFFSSFAKKYVTRKSIGVYEAVSCAIWLHFEAVANRTASQEMEVGEKIFSAVAAFVHLRERK